MITWSNAVDYMLDTHVLLWLREGNPRLKRSKWEPLLFSSRNTVYVSIVSLWEIAIKRSLGKLDLDGSLDDFARTLVTTLGFKILQIDVAHLTRLDALPFHHRDPFDRLLIAQAIELGAVAITDDAQWAMYSIKTKW